MEKINNYEFICFGLRRSGHHAIVMWLASLIDEPVLYLNNACPNRSPFDFNCNEDEKGMNRLPLNNKEDYRDLFMVSYEDYDITKGLDIIPDKHRNIGSSNNAFNIIMLRDPFNFMASRYKCSRIQKKDKSIVELWKKYARAFLEDKDNIYISFNAWFSCKEYREYIAGKLGLENNDIALNTVTVSGKGSSFDYLSCDGKAQEMKVLSRWDKFKDDDKFRNLFDTETFELSEKIFGKIEGIDYLKEDKMEEKKYLEIGPNLELGKIGDEWDTMGVIGDHTYLHDMGKVPYPIESNTYDVVYASHVIEHIPWYDVPKALLEIKRILKPGGVIELWVPDMDKLVIGYINNMFIQHDTLIWRYNEERDPVLWFCARVYGCTDDKVGDENWHRGCFNGRLLAKRLTDAGFKNVDYLKKPRGYDHGWINLGMSGTK